MPVSSTQYGQTPWQYLSGLGISNNTTTPNTLLNIDVGSCLDITGTYQLTLNTPVVINAASNGLNGLDTGTLAASTVYAVYLVADPVTQQPAGCMLSLGYKTVPPLLPFGYSAYALLGFCTTDSSSHILLGYWAGAGSTERLFMYDAPQATAVTAGAATTYTAVDLSHLVPTFAVGNIFGVVPFAQAVYIDTAFTPGAAGRVLNMHPGTATGDMITITGQATSVPVTTQSILLRNNVAGVASIAYKVSNAGDAVAINVGGYVFFCA